MLPADQYAPPEREGTMRLSQALHGQSCGHGWHREAHTNVVQEAPLAPRGQQFGIYFD